MSRRSSNKGAADKLALWPMWALCGVLLLVIIAGITRAILDERPQPSDIAVVELPAASEIRFQSADFPTGELRQFRISGSGVLLTVKRLVDGHVHAAFSSCKACSRQGRRSYARQNQLLCGVCNHPMRFENDANTAREANKSCPLPEIPISEDGGKLVIAPKDVLKLRDQALTK